MTLMTPTLTITQAEFVAHSQKYAHIGRRYRIVVTDADGGPRMQFGYGDVKPRQQIPITRACAGDGQ